MKVVDIQVFYCIMVGLVVKIQIRLSMSTRELRLFLYITLQGL